MEQGTAEDPSGKSEGCEAYGEVGPPRMPPGQRTDDPRTSCEAYGEVGPPRMPPEQLGGHDPAERGHEDAPAGPAGSRPWRPRAGGGHRGPARASDLVYNDKIMIMVKVSYLLLSRLMSIYYRYIYLSTGVTASQLSVPVNEARRPATPHYS